MAVNILHNIERNEENSNQSKLCITLPSSFIERYCSNLGVSPDMVERCKKEGVGIIADAVINHMAAPSTNGDSYGINGTNYHDRQYEPYDYDASKTHTTTNDQTNCKVDDYSDANKLLKIREHIEKNFEFVGDKFSEKVRDVYYDKETKKSIYGTTTPEEKNAELKVRLKDSIQENRVLEVTLAHKLLENEKGLKFVSI